MNVTASPTGVARSYIARYTNVDEALRPCASCATLLSLPDYVRVECLRGILGNGETAHDAHEGRLMVTFSTVAACGLSIARVGSEDEGRTQGTQDRGQL